jgi:uncharacterized protein
MIFKILTLAVVIFLVYIVFFKKSRENNIQKRNNEKIDTMCECPACGTFVTKDDAVLSNGKYYCSKECL